MLYDHHETMLQCSSETGSQGIKLLLCNSVPGYSFDNVGVSRCWGWGGGGLWGSREGGLASF